ncbi:IQEC3 protein, partial [Polyodon spathula]|nr:IQEC3 protein [Polyodon spathula]
MESLLENPMKAVLYLKELTTIVQNQQSLIQTQRQRIDELERKVEELIGENRNLKDKPQPQPEPQPQPHPQQQLHLVSASPPTPPSPQSPQPNQASLEPAEAEKKSPCCKSLVPQKSAAICRAVVLGRKSK